MRDRLIELWGYAIDSCKSFSCAECEHNNIGYPKCMDVHISDYLLANGVIVPPCKVGDTVYRIAKLFCGKTIIVEGEVFEFAITHESAKKDEYRFYFRAFNEDFAHRQYSKWCDFFDFGKTVFLTREEAEAKLKGEQG